MKNISDFFPFYSLRIEAYKSYVTLIFKSSGVLAMIKVSTPFILNYFYYELKFAPFYSFAV